MCFKTFEICVLKYMNLILLVLYRTRINMVSSFKKTTGKLDFLTDIDMLLMVETGIRGGICHSIYR